MSVYVIGRLVELGQLKTILEPKIKMECIDVENIGGNGFVSITKEGENTLEISVCFNFWKYPIDKTYQSRT